LSAQYTIAEFETREILPSPEAIGAPATRAGTANAATKKVGILNSIVLFGYSRPRRIWDISNQIEGEI
jgi:hypothetical protein